MPSYGVYIGENIEVILTENYAISYRRNREGNYLESALYKKRYGELKCIGVCKTYPASSETKYVPNVWQSAFIYNGDIQATDEEIIKCIGRVFPQIINNGNTFIISFDEYSEYVMHLNEELIMEDFFPKLPDINANNISECLKIWNVGIMEEVFEINSVSTFIGIIINTYKHMYIFEMTTDSIYCRAARFFATNKGVIFNQNFRQGLNAFMIEDNREAGLPLEYDDAFFTSDSCAWNNRSVYWSVKNYDEKCIELNGCQNDYYYWKKPIR